jgi:outer membrane protein assembly factor BamB
VYTLNYSDGKILWKADSKRYLGYQKTSQIYHDFLVVPEENRYLVTYSLKKGQLLWRELPSKNNSDYSTHIESISSGDDKVFVARYNSTLTAYNITNGNIMWKVNAPDRSFLYTIFDQGIVYLSGNQNLTAFDAITGDQLWRLAFEELVGPIVIDHNTLYIALATGGVTIEAFSLNNHGFLWKKEFLNFDLYDTRFLVSENDILYLPNQALVALSGTDGKFLWETLKTGRLGKPVFIDGKIIVRNYNSDLFEFDAETGKQLGSLMIQTNSFADLYSLHASDRGPAVSNELLIIPFGDNRVYAYKP